MRLVLGSVQDLQQGDHKSFSLPRIGRWILFINDSSSSECMGLVYEVATQDVRSDLLFSSFVFCRHSREKYIMKLSDVFNKAFVYIHTIAKFDGEVCTFKSSKVTSLVFHGQGSNKNLSILNSKGLPIQPMAN